MIRNITLILFTNVYNIYVKHSMFDDLKKKKKKYRQEEI